MSYSNNSLQSALQYADALKMLYNLSLTYILTFHQYSYGVLFKLNIIFIQHVFVTVFHKSNFLADTSLSCHLLIIYSCALLSALYCSLSPPRILSLNTLYNYLEFTAMGLAEDFGTATDSSPAGNIYYILIDAFFADPLLSTHSLLLLFKKLIVYYSVLYMIFPVLFIFLYHFCN